MCHTVPGVGIGLAVITPLAGAMMSKSLTTDEQGECTDLIYNVKLLYFKVILCEIISLYIAGTCIGLLY